MASSPSPPALDELGNRRFSFYPPIVNIEHNEWEMRRGAWSEVLVHNPKMDLELWIPRAWLGEISKIDEPVMIVGLRREIEYSGGTVFPHTRRVLQMPKGNAAAPAPSNEVPRAPTTREHMRLETSAESSIGKLIAAVLAGGILLAAIFVVVSRFKESGGSVEYRPVVQADLGFTAATDYFDVVRVLGKPDKDRWRSETGERQYRALTFTKAGYTVILMGAERNNAHYIGTKDLNWKTIHAVELPGGRNTEPMLRSLGKF
ncbi:MAG: hypothetical protein IT163_19175 [Bryobacterales bacterium]|nr:hypothetical protein [Bryobacterales bacterium]